MMGSHTFIAVKRVDPQPLFVAANMALRKETKKIAHEKSKKSCLKCKHRSDVCKPAQWKKLETNLDWN